MADPFGGALPITTSGVPVYQDRFLSEFAAPTSDVLGAWYRGAYDEWPLNQMNRLKKLDDAEHGLSFGGGPHMAPDSPMLSADDAKKQVEAKGLQGQIEIPETGLRQHTLDLLMEHRVEQNRRGAIMARSPGGFALNAAGVAGTLAVSALDPLNLAMGFFPVVGEARYARLLAAAGESMLGRIAVRAGVGAVEGVVGGAALEPLHIQAARAYGDDYTMNDSLANLAFYGAFGAALHQLPAAASWALGRLRRGIPLEYQKAAMSESLSAFMEDRAPRVSEMMEGIRRSELMGSTSLARATGGRFDPMRAPDRFEMPEAGAVRAPEAEMRVARVRAVEARARQIEPEAFAEADRLTKQRETYSRWIDELRATRERAATESVQDLDAQISRTREQMDGANQRKTKTYQKRLDDLQAERDARMEAATKADTPDMARVRQKLQQADFRLRDLAETVSAAKRRAEAEIPERSAHGPEGTAAPDLAVPGAMKADAAAAGPAPFDAAMRATAPDIRVRPPAQDPGSLTGVLTRIRDDRVNLPPDDARMAAETTRQTPLYNKPPTPETTEAELAGYAAATDEAVEVMQATGRLTEADKALLVEADQMVAQAEYTGSGWKAAAACIARAFT